MNNQNFLSQFLEHHKNFLTHIVTLFTIINVIVTISIGAFALFIPNLHVEFFKKEPTFIILIIIVLAMVILSLKQLRKKVTLITVSFIISFVVTFLMIYSFYTFLQWYIYSIEGSFNFRLLSFTKKASIEAKLEFFYITVHQLLEIVRNKNPALALFIEKSPAIVNPSNITINHTPYDGISNYAQQCILHETDNYEQMLLKVTEHTRTITTASSNSDVGFYIKCAIGIACIAVATYCIYYYFNSSTTIDIIKDNQQALQSDLLKTQETVQFMNTHGATIVNDMIVLTDKVSNMTITQAVLINKLDETITAQESQQYVLDTIQPIIQLFYVALKKAAPEEFAAIRDALTEEQLAYLRLTRNIIF